MIHRDCDSDGECSCPDPEIKLDAVVIEINGYTAIMQRWSYELLTQAGVELPLAEVMFPPSDPEHGYVEI